MLGAVDYLARAIEMRRFAEQELNPTTRAGFLRLAAEYEKLAERAGSRAQQEQSVSGSRNVGDAAVEPGEKRLG